ncbi:MAG: Crp/Fnr family transcriptional regulator [Ignavibacterium sp.]|jgi:CRP/FNR family transcriptional regulator|nr:MAG: Crp/Fnr family transcriptional regulator [Ignavibacterium sp.]MDD5607252.1 Crp/Fnr family transcriptional regulator [Ignavibacterium sp.]MDX9712193.1 Crp/Fnr family transcriptional regulator [Ignavibacteriaceae bacterium]MEB2355146.1 Crp/Fnr family transcriptional regulator [Ignavibacteriales bacterium]GIK22252.1 MAG: Crp/Fnr family transcriptional regulator [Ignavibacteriota bacterium]
MIIKDLKPKETLRDIPLFSELSIEQLRKISVFSKVKKFSKNEIIFNEDDTYIGFYILLKGNVKVFKVSSKGKESVVHIIKPLNTFADIPLFEGGNYPVSAVSLDETVALLIPKESFLELIKTEQEISLKMLAGFAKRLKSLINQLEDVSSREVPGRLAKYLLGEIKSAGTYNLPEPFVKLAIPKSTIAAYLGTITETLSRAFKKLQIEEIIRVSGKTVFVTNLTRLEELSR